MTAIATEWLDDGTVDRLEKRKRADARERQVVARGVLSGLEIIGHPSAYFLWLPMPEETRADQVAAALLREGISVSTAEAFATSKDSPHVRAGLRTGECEIRGDDIGGIGVHIGARVSALAGPNDVLVSSTLRDLVIGSGLEFEERGAHALKGVPGEWRLFAVTSP